MKLFCYLALISLSFESLADTDVESQLYEESGRLASEILKIAPPDKSVYLAIGQSPLAVGAMLELMQPGSVHYLPFSSAEKTEELLYSKSTYFHERVPDLSLKSGFRLKTHHVVSGEELKQRINRHFDRFVLPLLKEANGKEIFVFDYTKYGSHFFAVVKLLKDYVTLKCPECVLRFGAVVNQGLHPNFKQTLESSKVTLIPTSDPIYLKALQEQDFDKAVGDQWKIWLFDRDTGEERSEYLKQSSRPSQIFQTYKKRFAKKSKLNPKSTVRCVKDEVSN